jgi:hypothetical protein
MRNTAAVVRQGDTNQAYQVVQAKATAEREQQSVSTLQSKDKAQVRHDAEGGQGQQYEETPTGKRRLKGNRLVREEFLVPPDPNGEPLIDIYI